MFLLQVWMGVLLFLIAFVSFFAISLPPTHMGGCLFVCVPLAVLPMAWSIALAVAALEQRASKASLSAQRRKKWTGVTRLAGLRRSRRGGAPRAPTGGNGGVQACSLCDEAAAMAGVAERIIAEADEEYTAETRGLEGNANDLEAGVGTYAGRLEAGGGRQDSRGSCAR